MGVLVLVALLAGLLSLVTPARAATDGEVYDVPGSGTFELSGLGFGHGIGMSQFGAEGMGRLGKSYREILRFYYPGTTMAEVPRSRKITVGLSGLVRSTPQGSAVVVRPRNGLTASGRVGQIPLPPRVGGEPVTSFRVVRHKDALAVWAVSAAGVDKVVAGLQGAVRWSTDAAPRRSRVTVWSSAGGNRTYRGALDVTLGASSVLAVNRVLLEDYLRSVVSSEVPSSWTKAALQAQAVAARSYALLAQVNARKANRPYDICDTTYCQVYSPVSGESAPEVAAVKATAGTYLRSAGQPVFAMFSSANGGYSVSGSRPYLVAQPDPYDGVVTGSANWGHSWTASVRAATIEKAWPQIGTLKKLKVLGRDGNGAWGGRVLSVGLVGSAGTVSVSADSFRWATGLKSTWWTVTNAGGSATEPATNVRVERGDRAATVRWRAPDTGRDVRGYRITVSGTKDTHRVDGDTRKVRIRGLTNGQQYRAHVQPLYRSGPGPRTASRTFVPTSSFSYFRPLSATRLVDQSSTPAADQGGEVSVAVTGSDGAPRAGTRAVAVRVVASSAGRPGRVLVSSCGAGGRSQVAVAYQAGEASVGLVTVPARTGRICLAPSSALDTLRVDLLGYYTSSGVDSTSLRAVAARRVVDSTTGLGWGSGRLTADEARVVRIAGRADVPEGVRTVLLNIGLQRPTENATISVAAPGTPWTLGAAVRAAQGQWRTGTVVAYLDENGRLPLRLTNGKAHVQIDVLGWFRPQRGDAAGRYRTTDAVPVLEPRSSGPLGAGESRTIEVRGGETGIPASARAVVVQALARGDGGAGYLTVVPQGSDSTPRPLLAFSGRGTQRALVVVPIGEGGMLSVTAEDAGVSASFRVIGWYS